MAAEAVSERPGQDRGIPQLNARRKGMPIAAKFVVAMAVVLGLAGAIAYVALDQLKQTWQATPEGAEETHGRTRLPPLEVASQEVEADALPLPAEDANYENAADLATAPESYQGQPTPAPSGGPTVPALTAEQAAAADLQARRQRAPLMAYDAGMGAASLQAAPEAIDASRMAWPFQQPAAPDIGGTLKASLEPTQLGARTAARLPDPNMTLTQASVMPCVLNTAIDSTVPGMVSCTLTADVYSTNGRVLLLERGSRIVGEYQNAALKQGMNRVFVLWTRVETPLGVLMSLDSPAADGLGRSGVTGKVNNHFWQRFGAGLLLSLVDDALTYATQSGGGAGGQQAAQFPATGQAGQDAASIAVENSVGIPPTLSVSPGALLNVFVARDLYFGNVYSLRTASR